MHNKNLEKLIPIVADIINTKINTYNQASNKDKKNLCHITKKFNGYFASFGPSVLMAGLYQTIYFYHDKEHCVNDIVLKAIKKMEWGDENTINLTDMVEEKNNTNMLLKNRILEVIIACKLVIRTFELEE